MKKILILVTCAFCILSNAQADDYATIVRYLGENGHFIISPDEVAKVQAYMKAHGYQHVSDIPKDAFIAGDPVTPPTVAEISPSSGPKITHIVVPSATPESSFTTSGYGTLIALIIVYCIPLLIALERRHRQVVPLAILNVAFGWTVIGWICCLAWALAHGKEARRRKASMPMDDYLDRVDAENRAQLDKLKKETP